MKETDLAKKLSTYLSYKRIPHHHNVSEFFMPNSGSSYETKNRVFGLIKKFKQEGWTSGFPDYIIFTDKIIFLELKKEKSYLTPNQKEWRKIIEDKKKNNDYIEYYLIRGEDELIDFLKKIK